MKVITLAEMRARTEPPPSLRQLSEYLHKQGARCGIGHLSEIERGIKKPGPKTHYALRKFYGLTYDEMERVLDHSAQQHEETPRSRARRKKRAA